MNICNPVRIFPIRGAVKNKQVDKLEMAGLRQAMERSNPVRILPIRGAQENKQGDELKLVRQALERSNQQSKRSNIMRRGFGAGRTVDGKIRILKRETALKMKRKIQDGKIRILRRSQSFGEK